MLETAAPKLREWPSYCNFCRVTPKAAFSEKAQRGDKGKFFKKSPKRMPSLKRRKSTLAQMALFSNLYPLKLQRLEKILRQTRGAKSARMAKLWQFLQGHPNPAFSVKEQRGDKGKFFKNRPKSSPRLKGPKAHWRKWHYPLISTHLKCKHWKTFWRKMRLHTCSNGQVMAIFARSFKTRIF